MDFVPNRLPEDPDAERALLATLCAPGNELHAMECAAVLRRDDFMVLAHQAIFDALNALLLRQEEVNSLTLKSQLDLDGKLGLVSGYTGLTEILLGEEVGRPMALVRVLQRKRKLRELIKIGHSLAFAAAGEESEPEALVQETCSQLAAMMVGQEKSGLQEARDIADAVILRAVERMEGKRTGTRTGMSLLDYKLGGGLQPGNLIVLAARPGIGKTALALNWLLRAITHELHAAFFSLEMTKEEVYERLVSAYSSVNLRGDMTKSILDQVARGVNELADLRRLHICDQAAITAQEITAMADRHIAKFGKLDLLVIDYLQLVSSPANSRGAKQSEAVRVGEISRALKLLAKDRQVPVVLLSQLNREVEHRQGGRPQLSDLRDSGAIEQDADVVMFIHRRMKAESDVEEPDRTAELIIAKQRNGPIGIVPLIFDAEYTRYREADRLAQSDPNPSSPGSGRRV